LKDYTASSKTTAPVEIIDEALGVFLKNSQSSTTCFMAALSEGFMERPHSVIPEVANFVLGIQDGKKRFADASAGLSKAHALVNSHPTAIKYEKKLLYIRQFD
jgi:type I restriction enzyme R subunit